MLVGPDNGLLSLASRRFGGIVEAVDIGLSPLRLEPASATFHGRDIFAPVAAHIAAGAALAATGEPFDPDELTQLDMPLAQTDGEQLVAHAIAFDRFGNVTLDVEHEELAAFGLRLGQPMTVAGEPAVYATTFADVAPGDLLVYEDAYRALALAVNRGSAVERLGLELDAEVRLRPAVTAAGCSARRTCTCALTASTNDRARELAAAGAPHGTLVTAAEQCAGRGRQGRTWSAPPGHALLMSVVLRDPLPELLPLAAGLAVAAACWHRRRSSSGRTTC